MPSKAALQAAADIANKGAEPLPDDVKKPLLAKAAEKVARISEVSTIFDPRYEALLSRFEENEVKLGKLLGTGGFCSVFEVNKLDLTSVKADKIEAEHKGEMEEHHARSFMSMACIRNGEARYAVKRLSADSNGSEELYGKAVADLATEARFLTVIQHPNIIKVRGFALGNFCSDDFFLMMDRLYDTLETGIRKWRGETQKYKGFLASFKGGKKKCEELFIDRINFAWDLSSAMAHIHEKRVIYRDLKPENVGFDIRGDVKIFDFGLAKELKDVDEDGNYNLTGYCGSPIYMAPEVIQSKPYNEKADVHSYAIMLWEMMALKQPYDSTKMNLNLKSTLKLVVHKDYRPKPDKDWPQSLTKIIQNAWHPNASKRLSFYQIKKNLHDCVMDLGNEGEDESFSLDKSTRSFKNFMEKTKKK